VRRGLPQHVGALALAVLLVYLVVIPVATIVWGSLGSTPNGVPGPRTLEHYRTALSSPTFVGSIRTTLAFAGGATVVSTVLGGYLAWVTERTDAPGRRLIYALVLVPIVVPGILTTIAWTLVLHERIGIANGLLAAVGVSRPWFDAYTLPAMIWVEGLDSLTLPFLIIAAALRTMDPAVEEASVLSGASTTRTAFRITLPLILPVVSAAALLVFVRNIGSFAVPAAMGLPGGVRVLATEVFLAARRFPSNTNLAAAYAVLHLVIAVAVLALHQRLTRHGDRFVTVGARVAHHGRVALRRTRTVHAATALSILGVAVVLPLVVVVVSSLLPRPMPPTDIDPSLFTLRRYTWAFESVVARRALLNNVVVGGLASVATVLIAAVVAWVSMRSRLRWRRLLDVLATAPIALPGTVLGLALLWWYLIVPLPIYATRWIVGIAFVTAFLPYAVRTAAAMLGQVSPALEEASAMSGAGWSRTFARIVLPLIGPGLLAAWLYVVARTFKSLALPALLSGPGGEMLPSVVYDLYESARYSELNALGVLMVVGLLAIAGLARLTTLVADRFAAAAPDTPTTGARADGAPAAGSFASVARQERTAE
jgi:iron(III) transport system permease protein